MKIKLLIISVLTCSSLVAQVKTEKLSFEFGYGVNNYEMGKLNRYFIDSFASKTNPPLLEKKIEKGQTYSLAINYRPSPYFNIGLLAAYQYSRQTSSMELNETDNYGNVVDKYNINYALKTEGLSVGLSSTLFLNSLFKFQEKKSKLLSNLKLGVGLNGGVGFSTVISDVQSPTYPMSSAYYFFTSTDFQGKAFVDVGYYFLKSNLFSSVGVKLGYQYFATKTVQDRFNKDWIVNGEYAMNLDFSGVFLGAYIMIGR
jgi:hypothetical protein